ncbi:MAG: hypothetical protein JO353_04635, partial [Phycisphaerae bacterium]|nr:hypothetical protein [Phycisphaerae bacterium]
MRKAVTILWLFVALMSVAVRGDEAAKPKIAVFPLGGSADADAREKVAFSFRAKLDRQGAYEPIDGPTMNDLVGETAINYATPATDVTKLAASQGAVVMLWGELDGKTLRLHTLDTRQNPPAAQDIEKEIAQPTDLRFAVEQVLETLPGIEPFEHPSETSVQDDPQSKALFAKNPNLVKHG